MLYVLLIGNFSNFTSVSVLLLVMNVFSYTNGIRQECWPSLMVQLVLDFLLIDEKH